MPLHTCDFDYQLPEDLIAQTPVQRRDQSRLLVYHRDTKAREHRVFADIVEYLRAGDVLVVNDTRVIPARLLGNKLDTGGKMEFLLLKRIEGDSWQALAKPARRAQPGTRFVFGDNDLIAEVITAGDDGLRTVRFTYDGRFEEALDRVGVMPLPPYIHQRLADRERYQTVYAQHQGSAAAPTAGLHFTPELLETLQRRGVKLARVLLHVGLGTFRPVAVDDIRQHKMHSEYYSVTPEAAAVINAARAGGGRVVAVGTTSARVLETVSTPDGVVHSGQGDTNIFIYPGYAFKAVDALVTNFHLPHSTLLMMISALAGREEMLAVYREAVELHYRFFSFGDAMLIL
ncbi:MAG: tRNA preQ1(34) S-adenosylmethionine ribosyltransferase-isomerase QueA [Eubacteriales bacterium]|nr:tRNA preQ1(34) S-adenosylmethionine ribosyltransferase-isomerase QueA [Eubacteriales bacterium]